MRERGLLVLLAGLFAIHFDAAFGQAAGGGGSGGGGLRNSISVKPGCKEGRNAIFYENVNGSDRQQLVFRTCKDGSYMTDAERAAYIYNPDIKCSPEGRTTSWEEPHGDHMVRKPFICKGGNWVPF